MKKFKIITNENEEINEEINKQKWRINESRLSYKPKKYRFFLTEVPF